ncbi:MAG: stress-induced protein [Candidatus Gastranaerophilales bacterium]|nr:stress-induced protein [Candidatus Gastranaerophilales bacterium]
MSKEGGEKKRGRGFAGMDPEKQREIAKKGGEHSHGGGRHKESEEEKKGGRGFAGMDPEKQREIAKKGGEHSHGGGRPKESEEEQE